MKILVCIKQVPDTASKISITPEANAVAESGLKFVLNPYDEFAVEEALKLKEQAGFGEVVVVTLGPKRSEEALRYALAMGADRAIHYRDDAFKTLDSLGIAKLIQQSIQNEQADLALCGKQAADDDNAQFPAMLGQLLGWPCVSVVEKLEWDGQRQLKAERHVGGGAKEVWQVDLPAVISAEKGLNAPRYASLPGIMKAKSKPLVTITAADCGLSLDELKPSLELIELKYPAERQAGKMLEGSPEEMAKSLVQALRQEAKVI